MFKDWLRAGFKWSWFWPVLYGCIIFILSSLPMGIKAGPDFRLDLIVHFFEFAFLGFLVARALSLGKLRNVPLRAFVVAVLIGMVCAALDEWHQSFVPGRLMEFGDFLADSSGIFTGAGLIAWLKTRKNDQ